MNAELNGLRLQLIEKDEALLRLEKADNLVLQQKD